MKPTNKAALLFNMFALMACAYTPLASASSITVDLGTLSLPFGIVTSDNHLAGNSAFSDYWTFTLDTRAIFVGSEVSTVITETSEIPGYDGISQSGAALSSLQIFKGIGSSLSLVAEAFSSQTISDPSYPFGFEQLYRTTETYNVFMNNVSLEAGTYTLAVNGEVFGDAPGSFSGSFSFIANNSQVSAVPLPSTVWLLGSGIGLMSFNARRKKS